MRNSEDYEDFFVKRNRTKNLIVLASLLVIGILGGLLYFLLNGRGSMVYVTVDGKEIAGYPLSKDSEIEITGYLGGTNILKIEKGSACILDADCPDKLCVHMGKISRNGQSIVCLPHRVIVTVDGKSDGEPDAVVGGY